VADTLRIKRRLVGGAAGAPSSLRNAELAFNEQDNTLYYGKGDSGGNATSVIAVGGSGAFQPLDADLTALAALTGTNVIYYRSAANTWSAITIGTGLTFSAGTLDAPVFTSGAKGEVPASGGGTANFLRADGTWAAPAGGGGGNVSNSGTPVAGQAAEWVTATTIKGVSAPTPHCGRLAYIGTTQLTFLPFNGDKIKINGVIYTIPGTGAGIAGLANTGVRVNNVAGQNLAANTNYWVFAENVSGTITAHFWTVAGGLAAPHHRPSQTAGNEGLEVWYNGTELPQFTLIGLIRTNASAQFVDTAAVRGVLSWFNQRPRVAQGKFSTNRFTASTSYVEINSEIAVGFLTWVDNAVLLSASGATSNSGIASGGTKIYVDAAAITGENFSTSAAGGYLGSVGLMTALGGLDTLTEGYHTATLYGMASGGTQTWTASSMTLIARIMG